MAYEPKDPQQMTAQELVDELQILRECAKTLHVQTGKHISNREKIILERIALLQSYLAEWKGDSA